MSTDQRPLSKDSIPADKGNAFDLAVRIAWPIHVVGYLLLLIIAIRARGDALINHDVAWLTVAAERWLSGGVLGRDIVELNTPLAILLYAPPAWAMNAFGLAPNLALSFFTASIALVSALGVAMALGHRTGLGLKSRQGFYTTLLVFSVLALFLSYDFAQRDHFIAMLFLPYAVLNAPLPTTTAAARATPGILRFGAALLAALAVCIKPVYVTLFAFIFLLLLRRIGLRAAWRQSAANAIILVGIVYVAIIWLLFPDWLPVALAANQLYAAYDMPLAALASQSFEIILVLLSAAAIANLRLVQTEILGTLCLLGFAVLGIAILQGKGWYYHFLAADLFVWTGGVILLVVHLPLLARHARYAVGVLLILILIPAIIGQHSKLMNEKRRFLYETSDLTNTVRDLVGPGEALGFIATSLPPAFPMVLEERRIWASRYPTLWPLAGAITLRGNGRLDPARSDAVIAEVLDNVVADFSRYRPKLIVVDERAAKLRVPDGFEFLPLFLKNPAFADLWTDYRLVGNIAEYSLYQRIAD